MGKVLIINKNLERLIFGVDKINFFDYLHLSGLATVNNISWFLKCMNYKHEKCLQPFFNFPKHRLVT